MKCATCDIDNCYKCASGPFAGMRLKRNPIKNISFSEDITEIQKVTVSSPIGGMQVKVQANIKKGVLQFEGGGSFILKPIPSAIYDFKNDVPLNEHLTMRIASDIYNFSVAKSGVVIIDGAPCYIIKRFDFEDGRRKPMENFLQLMQYSEATHGPNFKYESTYEEMGNAIDAHFLGPKAQKFELLRRVLFNYLVGNEDAHLGNFSGFITKFETYTLTPIYDILNTSLHTPDEAVTALPLFNSDESDFFKNNGFYGRECFALLGSKYGLNEKGVKKTIDMILDEDKLTRAIELISTSGLSEGAKQNYIDKLKERLEILNRSQ